MKLIVGLGNPGDKYKKTRHNLGFRVIDQLHQNLAFDSWHLAKNFKTLISQGMLNRQKIILAKPQTFMNNSGQTVKSLVDYYRIPLEEILIIHDEIDLPLGKIRIQKGSRSAGHQGVQSIINRLGTKNFIRMRIGIKPAASQEKDTEKFVLEKFTLEEEKTVQATIKKAADLVTAAF